MGRTIHVSASRTYNHPTAKLYGVISDYKNGLPTILPEEYFKGWDVEKGGQGTGTVVNVTMAFFGKQFSFRLKVTEPEPGKVLVETDTETGKFTRFTFKAVSDTQSTLTIDSEIPVKPGLGGYLQARNKALFAKRIYKQEMKNLADKLDPK